MTVGEIYIETLRLMFATGAERLTVEDLPRLSTDGQYADYILSMPGSMNRCLSDMENKNALRGILTPIDGSGQGQVMEVSRPELDRVTVETPPETVVGVPERLAALIPYYMVGDLYRHEDPALAAESRNWYEAGMEQAMAHGYEEVRQGSVVTVYPAGVW